MVSYIDKPLVISREHLEKYGFACFYAEPHPPTHNDQWQRRIEMVVGGTANGYQKIIIPRSLMMKLDPKTKIAAQKAFRIDSNVDAAGIIKLLAERAGWNQTSEDLELMAADAGEGVFIAKYRAGQHDISLGSGVVFLVNDQLAWIGMILVHPELRRQGIARKIMETCLSDVRLHRKQTIVGLDATPLGKQVYEALGFKDSFIIWRSSINTSLVKRRSSKGQFSSLDFRKIPEYLSEKGYVERIKIVRLLETIPNSHNLIISSGGKMCGFVLSRPGRLNPFIGPLIADNDELARELLMETLAYWKQGGFREVFMDIPQYHIGSGKVFIDLNTAGPAKGHQIEIWPARSFSRMYQLISSDENNDLQIDNPALLEKSIEAFAKSTAFADKEKNDVVPLMYGTSGPEWS